MKNVSFNNMVLSGWFYGKLVAALLILGTVLANIAFIGLGPGFNYPDILQETAREILRQFTINQTVILGRFGSSRMAVCMGVSAAAVQVIDLSRWIFIVPVVAQKGDVATFQLLNTILGTIIGEKLGYFFTGAWTILIIQSLGKIIGMRWFSWLGIISAILIIVERHDIKTYDKIQGG